MFGNVNLSKPSGSAPGGAAPKGEIIIIDTEILAGFPSSDVDGVLLVGQFVFIPGKFPIRIYSTKSKTEADYETSGDEDSPNIAAKIMLQHPGNKLEVKEFVQRYLGRDVIVLHKACGDNFYEVMGTPCAPLQLKASKKDGNDGRFHTLTFEPFAKSNQVPKHYTGVISFAAPFAVNNVATTVLSVANGSVYLLPSLAVAAPVVVTELPEHGKFITFIGSGGLNPPTISTGVSGLLTFIMRNGVQWVAIDNATITFSPYWAGGTVYMIEQSRT